MPSTRITYNEDEIKQVFAAKHSVNKNAVVVNYIKGYDGSDPREYESDRVEVHVNLPKTNIEGPQR